MSHRHSLRSLELRNSLTFQITCRLFHWLCAWPQHRFVAISWVHPLRLKTFLLVLDRPLPGTIRLFPLLWFTFFWIVGCL